MLEFICLCTCRYVSGLVKQVKRVCVVCVTAVHVRGRGLVVLTLSVSL